MNLILVACFLAHICSLTITNATNAAPDILEAPVQQPVRKPIRVYADIVGDLFHAGHINFLRQAKALGDYLIVGVCNDDDCEGYKRRPILTMDERIAEISACKYVDEVYPNAPISITDHLIDTLHIDIIVHGDDFDHAKILKYYGCAYNRGMLRTVPYTPGISTTEIIRRITTRLPNQLKAQYLEHLEPHA